MSSHRGHFVWYELMTPNPKAAQAFYTKALEWGTQSSDLPGMEYTMWVGNGHPIGGVMALPPEAKQMGAPPHWMGYVAVNDVDATAQLAGKLGGKVLVPPKDIPTVGRICVVQDQWGAVIAAFKGEGEMPPAGEQAAAGEMAWHELYTGDTDAAMTFYGELFGWQVMQDMDMGEHGVYRLFGTGGKMIGGMFKAPEGGPPPSWGYYVEVADLDAALARIKEAGGQVINGPMDVPGGRIAQALDPQGAHFALHKVNG